MEGIVVECCIAKYCEEQYHQKYASMPLKEHQMGKSFQLLKLVSFYLSLPWHSLVKDTKLSYHNVKQTIAERNRIFEIKCKPKTFLKSTLL